MDKAETRIYVKKLLLALGASLLLLVVSTALLNASHGSAWWRIPVALAPMIPMAAAMFLAGRAVRRMDEQQRRTQAEVLAFVFVGAALVEGVVTVSHPDWGVVCLLTGALWTIGIAVAKGRRTS